MLGLIYQIYCFSMDTKWILRFDNAIYLLLCISARLSTNLHGSEVLTFPEFINMVSILYYIYNNFIILLHTSLLNFLMHCLLLFVWGLLVIFEVVVQVIIFWLLYVKLVSLLVILMGLIGMIFFTVIITHSFYWKYIYSKRIKNFSIPLKRNPKFFEEFLFLSVALPYFAFLFICKIYLISIIY